MEAGIEKGGADSEEPASGGGRVSGSLLGGNWKMEVSGLERIMVDMVGFFLLAFVCGISRDKSGSATAPNVALEHVQRFPARNRLEVG